MIRIQIVERPNARLFQILKKQMRTGGLRTFKLHKGGRKVTHVSDTIPGWMNWKPAEGVINCDVLSPHKPGREWHLAGAFVGRLADRFSDKIQSINIQFPKR